MQVSLEIYYCTGNRWWSLDIIEDVEVFELLIWQMRNRCQNMLVIEEMRREEWKWCKKWWLKDWKGDEGEEERKHPKTWQNKENRQTWILEWTIREKEKKTYQNMIVKETAKKRREKELMKWTIREKWKRAYQHMTVKEEEQKTRLIKEVSESPKR